MSFHFGFHFVFSSTLNHDSFFIVFYVFHDYRSFELYWDYDYDYALGEFSFKMGLCDVVFIIQMNFEVYSHLVLRCIPGMPAFGRQKQPYFEPSMCDIVRLYSPTYLTKCHSQHTVLEPGCVRVCVHVCMYVCIYVYLCVFVCVYLCVECGEWKLRAVGKGIDLPCHFCWSWLREYEVNLFLPFLHYVLWKQVIKSSLEIRGMKKRWLWLI